MVVTAASCWNLAVRATNLLQQRDDDCHRARSQSAVRRSRNKMTKKREQAAWQGQISRDAIGLEQLSDNPDVATYSMLLRRCGRARALAEGKRVHAALARAGLDRETRLRNLVIQMYGECGSVADARAVFDATTQRNIFSWNIMLAAYAHNGHSQAALDLASAMAAPPPDRVTYVILLHACSNLGALREGRIIHASVIACGLESHLVVATAILNMYAKCGSVGDAKLVFDKVAARDVVCWNSMIAAYAINGDGRAALELMARMVRAGGVRPDAGTFVAALEACSVLRSIDDGRRIHVAVVAASLEWNVIVATALVTMYGRCGHVDDALAVFARMEVRNVITWTAMLGALAGGGRDMAAVELFERMRGEGVAVDAVAVTIALEACARLRDFARGCAIHAHVEASGMPVTPALAGALLEMYGCCGRLDAAREAVARRRDAPLLWNALMTAYGRRSRPRDALRLFGEMARGAARINRAALVAALETCGSMGEAGLTEGRTVHSHVTSRGFDADPVVAAALVAMYGKCGSLRDAVATFHDFARDTSVVLWTSMIAAYGQHGEIDRALALLWAMAQVGLRPNRITFASVLAACRAANSLQRALLHFQIMIQDCEIQPVADHYSALVDLLARDGKLREAEELADSMPFEPSSESWMSLLVAAQRHSDLELGKRAGDRVLELEPKNGLAYLTLGKIYAEAEMWDELLELRKLMEERGLKRQHRPVPVDSKTLTSADSSQHREKEEPLALRSPVYSFGSRRG